MRTVVVSSLVALGILALGLVTWMLPVWAAPPVDGVKLINASVANPATGTLSMGDYAEAVITVEVSTGSNAVTISSRDCTDGTCAWVTETAYGGTATSSAPHKVRIARHYQVKVSVENAAGHTINCWYSLSGE